MMRKHKNNWYSICITFLVSWLLAFVLSSFITILYSRSLVSAAKNGELKTLPHLANRTLTWLKVTDVISFKILSIGYLGDVNYTYQFVLRQILFYEPLLIKADNLLIKLRSGNELTLKEINFITSTLPRVPESLDILQKHLDTSGVQFFSKTLGFGNSLTEFTADISTMKNIVAKLQALQPYYAKLLGFNSPTHYIAVLQNNTELRPTGGFMGSYLEFYLDRGRLSKFQVQDIYEPDGQLTGYVKEPLPIRNYLFEGHPGWRLRDSNWDADFPRSMVSIDWFFRMGKIQPTDTMIAVNLFPLLDIMDLIGPITLSDYQTTVNSKNFYQLAQFQAEYNFFPGSTQKRDFLSTVGKNVLLNLSGNHPPHFYFQLVDLLMKNIDEKQILIASKDPDFAQFLKENNWNGGLNFTDCGENCLSDYLHLNEANLGVNKANCCIERDLTLDLSVSKNILNHKLKITYINSNPVSSQPPLLWGGKYKNYLRIFVPLEAKLQGIWVGGKLVSLPKIDIEKVDANLQSWGFLVQVPGKENIDVEIKYDLALKNNSQSVNLFWQKQSGIKELPLDLKIDSQTLELDPQLGNNKISLQKDSHFIFKLK